MRIVRHGVAHDPVRLSMLPWRVPGCDVVTPAYNHNGIGDALNMQDPEDTRGWGVVGMLQPWHDAWYVRR